MPFTWVVIACIPIASLMLLLLGGLAFLARRRVRGAIP
jgi:hypothetical protein